MFTINWIAELANVTTDEAERIRNDIERKGFTPPYGWLSATNREVKQAIKLSQVSV